MTEYLLDPTKQDDIVLKAPQKTTVPPSGFIPSYPISFILVFNFLLVLKKVGVEEWLVDLAIEF